MCSSDKRLASTGAFIAAEDIPQGTHFSLEAVNTRFELAHAAVRPRGLGPEPDKQGDGPSDDNQKQQQQQEKDTRFDADLLC